MAVAFSLCGLAAGCASAGEQPAAPVEPGTTTVMLANRVEPPFRLERVVLDVDGQRMPLSAVPPAGAGEATLARVRLPPGQHTLQVLASAAGPGGGDGATVATLRTAQAFHVGDAPARVSVHLSTRDEGGSRQLDAAFRMLGGELAAPLGQLAPSAPGDDRCKTLPPPRRAVCRAETLVGRARERKDLAVIGCALEPLADMRSLNAALDDARRTGHTGEDAEVIRTGEERLVALGREVERCDVEQP